MKKFILALGMLPLIGFGQDVVYLHETFNTLPDTSDFMYYDEGVVNVEIDNSLSDSGNLTPRLRTDIVCVGCVYGQSWSLPDYGGYYEFEVGQVNVSSLEYINIFLDCTSSKGVYYKILYSGDEENWYSLITGLGDDGIYFNPNTYGYGVWNTFSYVMDLQNSELQTLYFKIQVKLSGIGPYYDSGDVFSNYVDNFKVTGPPLPNNPGCNFDSNGDGMINTSDLIDLLQYYGTEVNCN